MGAVSELFRTGEGTLRSVHPTHSIAARGPGAGEVVAGHERADTPFGEGTPFAALRERGAKQVFFGSGVRAITMYHSFEVVREPPYPIDVFWPERIDGALHRHGRAETEVVTLVHHPRMAPGGSTSTPASRRRCARAADRRRDALRPARPRRGALPARARDVRTFEACSPTGSTIYDPRILEGEPQR